MESTISAGSIARAPGNVMSKRRVVAAVTLGNALEFYDFLIYSFFAAVIGKAFFPVGSEIGSMLASLATFGVGFFFRPLGSIVLGAYADRRGRKAAMSLTLGLMALGTGIIAFAPTYAQIGVLAPALIVVGRILQGFSAGGEVGASTSMLAEAAPVRQRGFFISWQMASQGLAILVAALISFSLTELLDTVSLESWGWRVPFVIGMLIAPVGMYIRRNLKETFARDLDPHAAEGSEGAIADLARGHLKLSVMSTLIQAGSQITSYIFIIYLPTYAVVQLKMPASLALSAVVVSGIVAFLASPLLGSLSDRIGRKPLAWASRILSIAVAIPSFHLMNMQPPHLGADADAGGPGRARRHVRGGQSHPRHRELPGPGARERHGHRPGHRRRHLRRVRAVHRHLADRRDRGFAGAGLSGHLLLPDLDGLIVLPAGNPRRCAGMT